MKRIPLYSHSRPARRRPGMAPSDSADSFRGASRSSRTHPSSRMRPPPIAAAPDAATASPENVVEALPRASASRRERFALVGAGALIASLLFVAQAWISPGAGTAGPIDIDAAIQRKIDAQAMISPAVRAHQVIQPSVVRVRSKGATSADEADDADDADDDGNVGTGVVIVDDGTILTNLHVVAGAERITLVFANGFESEADVVGMRPEHDLAVLQAREIPDGLVAATMRSTTGLALGERVVAVGFPFGLGPSVSAGVVSGLRREFVSPEGQRVLTNLIQFDAAANPGSSGGPLVTSDGEVVGIVTGILNPRQHGVFIGIGFAVPIENAAGAAGLSPF